jgi:hypothetical protein
MKTIARVLPRIGALGAVVVLVVLFWIVVGFVRRPGPVGGPDDWLILLSPLIPPIVVIAGGTVTNRLRTRSHFVRGAFGGLVVTSTLYLAIPLLYLVTQFDVMSQDGTAYWGLATIPVFWIWLPAAVIGALAGATIAVLIENRGKRTRLKTE